MHTNTYLGQRETVNRKGLSHRLLFRWESLLTTETATDCRGSGGESAVEEWRKVNKM